MGNVQEIINRSKHFYTYEEKLLEDLSNSSFAQNIYVCGNYNLNFFGNNFIKDLLLPKKPKIRYYELMSKHNDVEGWHFFFAPKGRKFSEMLENIKNFLNDHNESGEFDDFNEGNRDNIGKNVILYFIDENKDNFFNYFINEHNQFELPLFIIIGNSSDNEQIKENINKSINERKRIIDKNIFKFFDISKDIENNYFNLNLNLIDCSAYYNELGDEFKYPKQLINDKLFDRVTDNIIRNFRTINILVCGRAGAGKSTFINGILDTTISRSKRNYECTQRIIKYIHRKLPITFYDTPGMSTEQRMRNIIDLIEKKNNELGDIQNKIHAIFYLFNGKVTRFFYDFENKMLELLLKKYKIPLYFLITQINREEYEENKDIIIINVIKNIENYIESDYAKEKIENNIFCINTIGDNYSEVSYLFNKMYHDFKKYIKFEKIEIYNLKEITWRTNLLQLNSPKDIIPFIIKLSEYIYNNYRILARSIKNKDKGSTLLSSLFLKIINNIFGKKILSTKECRSIIENMGFDLDKESTIKEKNFKSWFKGLYGYQTPAEEEISYLAEKYITLYVNELKQNNEKCLEYINKLRVSLNEAINGLRLISDEWKKK